MKKLAIIVTHPIQYHSPVFSELAKLCQLKVFYTWGEESIVKYDPGFGRIIEWDLPLLDGYAYTFLKNVANNPGSHHFFGIKNPDAISSINNFNPDAIFVYGWSYFTHIKIIRHFARIKPIYFRGDSTLLDPVPKLKSFLKDILLKHIFSHITKAFYVGKNNRKYFEKYGLKAHQLVNCPHAIDNGHFATKKQNEVDNLKNKLGIAKDSIVILFAGKFEPKKNPTLLLNTFINILDNTNEIQTLHLLFVGNGILEKKLKDEAIKYPKNIHFLDFQNQKEMPVIYQSCDLFCLPSQGPGETWGLAVNEAMAAGKAILASDKVGCAVDLVTNNGLIFYNDLDFHEKLIMLIKNRDELYKLGENSKTNIEKATFNRQVQSIISTLNEQ
jgi:glycosyltransferase involved in cell wall biosynthesis